MQGFVRQDGNPVSMMQTQPRFPWIPVLGLLAAAVAVVALTGLAAHVSDRPFGFFSREPSEVLREPWYMGSLFLVGVMIWIAAAVMCFFAAALVAGRDGRAAAAPLLIAGLLSAWLSFDDALRIHEDVFTDKLSLPKAGSYAVYAAAFGAWLWYFRDFILRTEWRLLAIACSFLGTSVVLDRVFEDNQQHVVEDGTKFVGIVAWTAYFAHTAYRRALDSQSEPDLRLRDERPQSTESRAPIA
jgi:hypothetical protein